MPTVIIVSLIDVFAILLIFVIVTTTFKRPQAAVTIKLPESSTAKAFPVTDSQAVLSVDAEGGITLLDVPVEPADLIAKIREIKETGAALVLKADERAPFGVIVRVLDALKEAGISGNLPAFTEMK